MRADNTFFSSTNAYLSKEPRYVVSIDFDGSVQYFTSHDDIANVPGSPIEDVLRGISATSQTLNPDRANATIGSMSFDLVDLAEAFTDHVRTELESNDIGLRGRTSKFYIGYASDQEGAGIIDGGSTDDDPDYDNFALFQTQIVRGVETKDGRYSVKCADIQRETKRQIFELALTYLTDSISETDTTIPVLDLSGFEGNVHGTGYTDAPSAEVIYIKLDKTKEIIRCPVSGISGNSFTNCVRGRFGTDQQAVEVDQTQASDRRPKVAEYVYLELPAVKMAYAILTGDIEGTANTLPDSWHAGVDTDFVRLTDFQNIGADLWDTTDDTKGVVLRFDGIGKQDAKRFLETEIYLLLGLFSPVYADGQLGLKRMVPSLSDSPYSFQVNDTNTVSTGNLAHDMDSVQNNIRVDWNWNGDRFIRSTIIVDSASIARHGQALEKRLKFRGLVGTRFTEQVLRQLLTSLRDMYTGPPLRLSANGFHLLNQIEVGDACRVDLSNLRDYSQSGSNLVRTMAVHGMTVDWFKGVKLKLFGSSERSEEIPPAEASEVLPDAFYSSEGDSLSTIGGLMSGNSTNSGSFTLTGTADMNADASIFYWANDLTISADTTINIEGNVQLRVMGFLTINGLINGVGEGLAAGSNSYSAGQHYYWSGAANVGNPGFIGNSKGHRGLLFRYPDDGGIPDWVFVTNISLVTEGRYQAFPNLVLVVDGDGSGSITGIPDDMRGGGGAYGSAAGEKTGISGRSYQRASGGAGGAGGAALCVVCRGGDFGVSGQITLDGDDAVEPTTFYAEQGLDYDIYGGCGGAGAPGALLWLLDGSSQTFPDLAGHFQAKTGEAPAQYALPLIGNFGNQSLSENDRPQKNMAPFYPDDITDYDQTGVNFRITYLPDDITPEDDQPDILTPPTNVVLTTVADGVIIDWDDPANDFDHIEIVAADEDVFASAVLVGTSPSSTFKEVLLELSARRFYWLRAIAADGTASVYEPDSSTTTLIAYPDPGAGNLLNDPDFDLSTDIPLFDISTADPDMHNTPWVGEVVDNALPSTTRDSELNFVSGGGVSGSNAIKFIKGDPGSSPFRSTIQFISTRRIRANTHQFRIEIRYRNQGAAAFGNTTPGDDLSLYMRGMTAAVGGTQPGYGQPADNGNLSFPVTGADWTTVVFVTETGVSPEDARYWFLDLISIDNQGTLAELEIDSIFIYPTDPVMVGATASVNGKPGLAPEPIAGDEVLFLRGDATYATAASNIAKTQDEIDANATIVSFFYNPGFVPRYGTNTTPLTTNMTVAIQTAINVASYGIRKAIIPDGSFLYDQLYWHYDSTNNPDYNSEAAEAGPMMFEGAGAMHANHYTSSVTAGSHLVSSETTNDTVFLRTPTGGTSANQCRIIIKHMTFEATTSGDVLSLEEFQDGSTLEHVMVRQKGTGNGIDLTDYWWAVFRQVAVVGPWLGFSRDPAAATGTGWKLNAEGGSHAIWEQCTSRGWNIGFDVGSSGAVVTDITHSDCQAVACNYGWKIGAGVTGFYMDKCNSELCTYRCVYTDGAVERFFLRGGGFSGITDEWIPTWTVALNDSCHNDSGKIYICTQAGTTAASGGPTGTGSGISDGTAEWDYNAPFAESDFAAIELHQDTISPNIHAANIRCPEGGSGVRFDEDNSMHPIIERNTFGVNHADITNTIAINANGSTRAGRGRANDNIFAVFGGALEPFDTAEAFLHWTDENAYRHTRVRNIALAAGLISVSNDDYIQISGSSEIVTGLSATHGQARVVTVIFTGSDITLTHHGTSFILRDRESVTIADSNSVWQFATSDGTNWREVTRTLGISLEAYTPTNESTVRSWDANAAVVGTGVDVADAGPVNVALLSDHDALVGVVQELSDVVATLAVDLQTRREIK